MPGISVQAKTKLFQLRLRHGKSFNLSTTLCLFLGRYFLVQTSYDRHRRLELALLFLFANLPLGGRNPVCRVMLFAADRRDSVTVESIVR